MWKVIRIFRGKQKIVFAGDLPRAKDFLKQMRDSQRKGIGRGNEKVIYKLEKQ